VLRRPRRADDRGDRLVDAVPTSASMRPRATRESSIAQMRESGLEDTGSLPGLTLGTVDVLPAGELERRLDLGRPLRVKLGIDPTAPDIHLGHVVVLEKLRQFQAAGHVAVLIIGDYTASVGDPSGRSSLRPQLSADEIEANALTYQEQAFKVLDPERTEVRRNSEWLGMPIAELFSLARRFTVARLLERDDFSNRMAAAEPISLLELLYPVLQGYDSVAVEADVELGGTEQKFNLLFGRDVQTSFGQTPQVVMTVPILPGTDGVRKMSKSLDNYVGVTEPPAEIFGKLMSVPDDAMPLYWELLLGEELDGGRHANEAKRDFARRICDRFAGPGSGEVAEARFNRIHQEGRIPDDVPVHLIADGGEVHLPVLIREAFGISGSEARRLIAQGAVRIDGEPVEVERLDVPSSELVGNVLQVGKRRFARIEIH
jgi:tyrosyl-tRNA synthetase